MNSTSAQGSPSKPPNFEEFVSDDTGNNIAKDPRNDQIAKLQKELSDVRSRQKEERFFWTLVLTIFLDFHFFSVMRNWGGPVVIGALEGIGLLVLAQKCEVDSVMPFVDRILDGIPRRNNSGGPSQS